MKTAKAGKLVLISFLLLCYACILYSQQIAFPGAEGYGKFATGGRGGKVIEVTNLNPSGPGSLAEALSASGPRTVVFRVSGTIDADLSISNGDITIAGQTAPGDGITIKGRFSFNNVSNVIVRYIRARAEGRDDAFGGRYNNNIIVDHVTASWSGDEVMSIYHGSNITIQWCMITEACSGNHKFGGIWGNDYSTYHHNLFAHNIDRNPRIASGAGYNDFRNNVIYNWQYESLHGGEMHQSGDSRFQFCSTNVVANYYKPGPGTQAQHMTRICSPKTRNGAADYGKWFVADNYLFDNPEVTADNWKGVIPVWWNTIDPDLDAIPGLKLDEPSEFMPINQETAEDAYLAVLEHAGCSLPNRDAVDTRIIEEVRNGTATYGNGFVSSPSQVGGWPELATGPAPQDSDHDGMPDTWEDDNGLDKNDPEDRNGIGEGGFTNLEIYLNSITNYGAFLMAPANLVATLQDFINVELTWEDVTDDETGFRLERAETDTGSFFVITELDADVTSYLDESLKELTLYRYRIMAFNDSLESGYTPTVEVTTLSPTAPPTAVSDPSPENDAEYIDTAPTLTWEASLNADSYDIYFGTDNPPPFASNQVETTYIPGELENGKKYFWRIDGINTNGTTEGQIWNFTVMPYIPAEQIAYWKFDETEGTTASDEEKYGLDGVLMNMDPPLWTTGIVGGGLGFDDIDDYVAVPYNGALDFADQSFSISLFVKVESYRAGSTYLINKGTFAMQWFAIELKNGELRFPVDDGSTKSQATLASTGNLLTNKWAHIAAVRDRAEGLLKLYVNGTQVASATDGTGSISENNDLVLGNSVNLDASLSGVLDEVKLFNYALSDAEVQAEYMTDIENSYQTIPNEFALAQNYPNPFNPSTTIDFSSPIKTHVKLEVFDVTGKKVATLTDEVKEAGHYSVHFDSSNLSTGLYFYRLTTVNNMLTRKMLFVK